MAITLVTTPDEFALTKGGRMLFEFTGSGQFESTGAKNVTSILFSSNTAVPDGQTITIRYGDKTVVMTAKTAPTQPGEFPAGNGSAAYVASILPYFKNYFPLRKDFIVEAFPDNPISVLQLTARRAGSRYTITPVGTIPSYSISAPSPAGGDPLIRTRYGVYVEVYLQKPGTPGEEEDDFELLGQGQHIEADGQGLMQFDAGDLLHGYLSADTPAWSATGGQVAERSHRKYYVAYAEAWGNPIKPNLFAQDQIRHAYLGGADFEHRADAGFSLETFLTGASAAEDRALRFGPAIRRVYLDEPAWLTFLNVRQDVAGLTLNVTLTFDDDSTAAATGIQAPLAFPTGEKICFPVGIAQRNLLAQVPAGKHLKEYAVQIGAGSTPCSRVYRYVVDYDQRPYRRFFAFQNSLGAFDCITTWGKGSRELQRFYDQAEKLVPAYYSPSAPQYVDFNVARQQQYEVASGWQTKEELIRWDDFYGSELRYLVRGTLAIAVGLTSKQIKAEKDGDSQFSHQFTVVELHRDTYYTENIAEGESLPYIGVPVGQIIVQPVVPVNTRDETISNAVRELTPSDINSFKVAAARPNPETLGFLTQQAGSTLFRRVDTPVSFVELSNKPNTRDGFGITDVPTRTETTAQIKQTSGIKPRLLSWLDDQIPVIEWQESE